MSKQRYRIGVVGPGGLGAPSIREICRRPDMDLAAVLAFSESKAAADVGKLVGIDPVGVVATTDMDEFIRSDISTVIYTARDYGQFEADEPIIRLLEAGKNVITPLPYAYPAARGGDAYARLDAAAKKGGATLLGTGITPGFFNEKLAMLMTNVTSDVTHIHMQELFNAADMAGSIELLQLFGFGGSMEAAKSNMAVAMLAENYLVQPIHFAADKLGFEIERIERIAQHKATPEDIETPAMTLKAGTVGLVSFRWVGYAEGKPFYTTEVFWYLGDAMRPDFATGDDFWTITLEGRPSVRVTIESKASIASGEKFFAGDRTSPGYYMTVIAMLHAVPLVEAAAPGILVPDMPQIHWQRRLAP